MTKENLSIMERAYMAYDDDINPNSNNFENMSRRHKNDLIRLTQLTSELQEMIDSRRITIRAGAKASQLPIEVQDQIYMCLKGNKRKLTEEIVKKINEVIENEFLPYGKFITPTRTEEILIEMQPSNNPKSNIPIKRELLSKLPEEYSTKKQQEALIEKLIEEYISKQGK